MGVYMPEVNLKNVDEIEKVKANIRATLSEKLKENLEPVDNSFALENFEYCTKELGAEQIGEIYTMLGPFDFASYKPAVKESDPSGAGSDQEEEFDPESAVQMEDFWIKRKSGAQFRG